MSDLSEKTVAELDELGADVEGYPSSGKKADKVAFLEAQAAEPVAEAEPEAVADPLAVEPGAEEEPEPEDQKPAKGAAEGAHRMLDHAIKVVDEAHLQHLDITQARTRLLKLRDSVDEIVG